MRIIELAVVIALGATVAGCEPSSARGAAPPAAGRVDSIIPREEALRRFRVGVPPVTRLEGGASSIDGLIAAVMRALGTRDTAALAGHALDRSEFAWLYYPTARQGLPPYDVEPGLLWFLLTSRSERGVRRALAVYGGQKLRVLGHDCGSAGSPEGENAVWGPCTVRWRDERGDTVSQRLLSQVVERDGRYKVLSYGNKL